MQPGGSTPNSGLNRKEKEEERKRELNKMREEARAKRAEEAVSPSAFPAIVLQLTAECLARRVPSISSPPPRRCSDSTRSCGIATQWRPTQTYLVPPFETRQRRGRKESEKRVGIRKNDQPLLYTRHVSHIVGYTPSPPRIMSQTDLQVS